jgi:enoyl-[acyl-carrier protein] reductase I
MMDISKENFSESLLVGCYSLIDIVRNSIEFMNTGGAYLTLSYDGARRVYDNYNVMGLVKASLESATRYLAKDCAEKGVRINCISAGVIKTSSAMAVKGSKGMLAYAEGVNPMKRNITLQDLAGSAYYFLSDLSSGVTGETHYVDCGYNIIGAPSIDDL